MARAQAHLSSSSSFSFPLLPASSLSTPHLPRAQPLASATPPVPRPTAVASARAAHPSAFSQRRPEHEHELELQAPDPHLPAFCTRPPCRARQIQPAHTLLAPAPCSRVQLAAATRAQLPASRRRESAPRAAPGHRAQMPPPLLPATADRAAPPGSASFLHVPAASFPSSRGLCPQPPQETARGAATT